MTETLREIIPGLWVSDEESAAIVGEDFSLVIDCTGRGPTRGNGRTLSFVPDGHRWQPDQLTTIATLVDLRLARGGNVLIHCKRGVSRSACAAAAALLWRGDAKGVWDAIDKVMAPGHRPATVTISSLKRWWEQQSHLHPQQSLF